ncbi:MAG: hypothetical protein QOC99_1731 [Acidobacteriota bacterium]|jgi:hypothetical protein|nr:hypothetical protein [Acidobacteriota bacterium]
MGYKRRPLSEEEIDEIVSEQADDDSAWGKPVRVRRPKVAVAYKERRQAMSATLDKIIEEVRALSPEERQQLREMLDMETRAAELRRIQSKYAHLTTSSEAFAARKSEEIEREDRRR